MKTIEIKLYKFSELSEKAKQKAIEDEAIIETIEANDYDFTENGERY